MEQALLLFAVALTAFAVWAIMAVFGPWWAGGFFVLVALYQVLFNRQDVYGRRPSR